MSSDMKHREDMGFVGGCLLGGAIAGPVGVLIGGGVGRMLSRHANMAKITNRLIFLHSIEKEPEVGGENDGKKTEMGKNRRSEKSEA